MLRGLNGAGKTTYARRLATHPPAVWSGLDAWMPRLYPYRYDTVEYAERAEVRGELICRIPAPAGPVAADRPARPGPAAFERRMRLFRYLADKQAAYVSSMPSRRPPTRAAHR
ncbi:AAA family ATPase [Streptomyces catenulae]|uniref:AAA family ATPase n=1 Tax=Streptomyces catenulae TaxID=66875 RepID=A0ABV2YZJ4_9ACTN